MVREEKLEAVEKLKELIRSYKTIGIVEMNKMPTKQLQEIKKVLDENAHIKMIKKSILVRAIEKSKKEDINKLKNHIGIQPAIILSNLDSFKLYSLISKIKPSAFAKEGDVLEEDVYVFAGPTNLMAGPVISEFAKLGIKAGIEKGKIVIKEDKIVAKKGDKVSKVLASVLRKLNIKPMKIGLNVTALYENGKIYSKDVLELTNTYPEKIKEAFNKALSFSVSLCYPTKENIKYLLIKAVNTANILKRIGGG